MATRLFAIGYLRSAICDRLFAIGYLRSAICDRLSAVPPHRMNDTLRADGSLGTQSLPFRAPLLHTRARHMKTILPLKFLPWTAAAVLTTAGLLCAAEGGQAGAAPKLN